MTPSPFPLPDPAHSAQIPITLQKLLDILPPLQSIHQMYKSRIFLQALTALLRQILVVANLVDDHIRVCNLFADDIWPLLGETVGFEVGFKALR